jgi:hypothetical protein
MRNARTKAREYPLLGPFCKARLHHATILFKESQP